MESSLSAVPSFTYQLQHAQLYHAQLLLWHRQLSEYPHSYYNPSYLSWSTTLMKLLSELLQLTPGYKPLCLQLDTCLGDFTSYTSCTRSLHNLCSAFPKNHALEVSPARPNIAMVIAPTEKAQYKLPAPRVHECRRSKRNVS